MTKTSIKYINYYIPENFVTVDDVISQWMSVDESRRINFVSKPLENFKEQSGLEKISVFDKNENIPDIVTKLVEQLICESNIKPEQVKYLVCGNSILMDDSTSTVHLVHKKFNLKNSVILPILQPCGASLISMGLSSKLLSQDEPEYIIILSARKNIDIHNRYVGFTIMGDGISVMLIENKTGWIDIKDWFSISDGSNSCKKKNDSGNNQSIFTMRIRIIEKGVKFIKNSLSAANEKLENVDVIIHPNTNYEVFHDVYSDLLQINPERFYLKNIRYGGHMNDVDIIRNINDYARLNDDGNCARLMMVYGLDMGQAFDLNYHLLTLKMNGLKSENSSY